MTYYSKLTKEILRDYQKKATTERKHNYDLKCRIALLIWETFNDIHKVSKYFGCTRDAAYKMVRKGKELKSASDNTKKP